jgi:predicted GIY-YIG superfamily endonuclease
MPSTPTRSRVDVLVDRTIPLLLCVATVWMWLDTAHVSPALAVAWTVLSYVVMSKLVAVRRARWTDRHALYRFRDLGESLLYIGITNSVELRWAQHRAAKSWWKDAVIREVHYYPTRELLEAAEKAAIKREHPIHNKAHNGVRR